MASPEKVKERILGKSTWVEVDVNNTNETLVSSRGSRDDPQVSQVSVSDSRINLLWCWISNKGLVVICVLFGHQSYYSSSPLLLLCL